MRYDFKRVNGPKVDLITHCKKVFSENPDTHIIIGTDSQNYDLKTTYVTVIAFRYAKRGVHCIYKKIVYNWEDDSKFRDNWYRLFHEAELSVATAKWIDENTPYDVISIDLDYNSDPLYLSNSVLSAGAGLVKGSGFKCNVKPDSQIAAKAADNFCR